MLVWSLIEKFVLKFGFEKRGILTKIHFYIKRSMEISGKGLLHFYQQASSLIGRGKICIEYSDVSNYNCNRRGLLTIKGNPAYLDR